MNRYAIAAASWALGLAIAHAEPGTDRFREGRVLLQEGNAELACAKFQAALELSPDAPGVMLNLGLCNAQQNKPATALKWFRRAQARAELDRLQDTVSAAKAQIAMLEERIAYLRVALTAPPAANVRLDGTPVSPADLERIEIDPGSHVIEVTGDGLVPVRRRIDVPVEARTLDVAISADEHARSASIDPGAPRRRNAKIAVAVGVGLFAVDVGLGLLAKDRFDHANSLEEKQRWQSVVRYGGTTVFGLGCAALATGAYLYFSAPRKRPAERTMVVPSVSPTAVSVEVTRWF